jgi:hypothetical protein
VLKSLKATGASSVVEAAQRHCCGSTTDANSYVLSSYLPLVALCRIITGKCEGCDTSCIDDDHGDEEVSSSGRRQGKRDDYNPLLETNRLLGESNAIPLLSQALAEALTAVTHQLEGESGSPTRLESLQCTACLAALQDRVAMLVTLIDGASLLSESNRQLFCEEGFTSEAGGFLLVGLVVVLNKLLAFARATIDPSVLFAGVLGEVMLSVLRMLTSLTHENQTAPNELETELVMDQDSRCGLQVLSQVLCEAVRTTKTLANDADGKLIYDSIIFCLNTFANVIESGGSCRILCQMVKPQWNAQGGDDDADDIRFLTWLTQWLVEETHSFRDALCETCDSERNLHVQEDEHLVTAGNGFVLLSCLLVDEKDVDVDTDPSSAYQIILAELPGSDRDAKMAYLKNTLKAFCNFYQYSIGGLSVAIVAPVKRLIQRIESIQDQRRRRSLGLE